MLFRLFGWKKGDVEIVTSARKPCRRITVLYLERLRCESTGRIINIFGKAIRCDIDYECVVGAKETHGPYRRFRSCIVTGAIRC